MSKIRPIRANYRQNWTNESGEDWVAGAAGAEGLPASEYHINTDPPPSLWSFILTIRVRDLEKIIKQN